MTQIKAISDAFERRERTTPHLLLVEDDETDILFVKRCLDRYGGTAELVVARDGAEALETLRDGATVKRPYVIVTDLNMPGMSGHELLEEIRSDEALKDSVVFVLSSSCLAGDIERAYRHNVAGYLTKRVPTRQLKQSVEMIFDYCDSVHLPA